MGRKGTEISIELQKLIISHYKNGKSLREISEIMNRSKSTIQYIIKSFNTESRIENKVRHLNRKLLTDYEERQILKEIRTNPKISAPKIASKVETKMGKKVSNETVRHVLRRYGYNGRVTRKMPYISEVNCQKRLQYVNKYAK